MKPKSLYDAGFEAGFNQTITMILKCVILTLYHYDVSYDCLLAVRDGIQDTVVYYSKNPEEMEQLLKEMEDDIGFAITFNGKNGKGA